MCLPKSIGHAGINLVFRADVNLGCSRDEIIVDRLTELKRTTGYPQKFQTLYAKNNTERIYNIGKAQRRQYE